MNTVNGVSNDGLGLVNNSPESFSGHTSSQEFEPSSPSKDDDISNEVCALCNCGYEMTLILGQLTRYRVSQSTLKKSDKNKYDTPKEETEIYSSDSLNNRKDIKEKVFHKRRRRKQSIDTDLNLPPDMTAFGTATMQEFADVLDNDGFVWAHHCCAAWSAGVCQTDSYDLENVDKAIAKALLKKCSHCLRYGASVECQVQRCSKLFHYPCCASAGAFQNITSMILLCPEHLDRSEKLVDAEAFCDTCQKSDNMQSQLFCTSCGRHFHSYCVDMNIPITPVVRMGWQCSFCKVCQGCKQPGDEEKMLCCDQCDKGYHIYCLNPPISVVPKSVWKCVSCRKCSDCGSSKPGSGPSCRWHNNFSLCDRCYQQRKKGQSCPICKRAVRLFNNGDAIQCKKCFKCVHGECHSPLDDGAEYICPDCIEEDKDINADSYENESNSWYDQEFLSSGQKVVSIEEAELFSLAASMNFIDSCLQLDNDNKIYSGDEQKFDGKESESTLDSPYSSSLISDSYQSAQSFRGRGRGHEQKMRTFKKSFRGRGHFSRNPNYTKDSQITSQDTEKEEKDLSNIVKYSDKTENGTRTEEDEENEVVGLHSTVVIVSTRDSFTLKQDICMCCGSLGKGSEGYLIGCVQCGQCFHPFCVNVMINEVILTRGWRCLDCSVCEGCGRNSDEGHLLLCDICDISFHTYCLDPPLEEVPIGGWKCQWCVVCEDCGSKDAGFDNLWMANYTQCGPCSSEQYCSICSYAYEANNLVIQCEKCNRWLHGECDGLYTEEDVELACNLVYHCIRCRPKTKHLGIYTNLKASTISKVSIKKAISCQNQIQRKTKPLVSLKAKKLSRSELKEQKRIELEAMPLIPQHAEINECGTFAIDLSNLKARLRMDDIEKPNFHLTETGLKEIKTQVIRAPIHRSNLRKERSISRKREETKNNSIMNEEVSCSIDPEDPSASVLGASFDLEGLGVENDLLSPGMLSVKQEDLDMDLMQPDTTQELDDFLNDEENEENVFAPEPEDVNDPFEFFGVNLLEKHLNMELESLETSTNSKQLKKEKKKERRMKRAAKLAEAARIAFDTMRGPSVTDNAMTIPLQKKPELVETLDLITPEMNPQIMITELEQPASDMKVEEELENKTPSSPVDIAAVPSSSLSPNHPISLDQNEDSSHLELMSVLDLPHVAGHEVEQMFAGLEQEMNSNKFITNKMSKSDIPSRMILSSLSSSGMPQPGLENQIKYSPSLLMSNISPHSSNLIQNIYPMDNDFEGKKSDGNGLNPKIDTQKQLRKWEIDEQLGENATISPVLYTNLMHKNLKNDFIDWPNRARAIARLWRKLPNEQREPFRIRARDNRVKLKERKGIRRHASRESPMTQNSQLQNSSLHDSQHNSQMKNSSMITSSFQNLQQNKNLHVSMPTMQMCNRFDDGEIIGSPKYSVSNSLSPTGLTTSLQANIRSGFTESPVASNISTPPSMFTVPEPQKLSPLLQRLSPHCAISSNNDLSPQLANTPTHANISSATEPTKIIIKSDSKIQLPSHKQEHYQQPIENALQEPDKKFQPLLQKRVFEQQKLTLQKDEIVSKAEQKETLCLSQRDDTQTISTQSNIASRNRALNDNANRNKSPLSNVNIASRIMKSPAIVSPPDSSVSNHDSDRNADIERYFNSRKNLDYSGSQMHNVDQQQAYMLQQQYMVAQQQYIQLQLAQQSTAPDGMYGIQKQPDKDLPDVDNEHEHQERLRFLFHQRQKEPSFGPQTMTPIKNTLTNQDSLTHHYDPMHSQGSSIMGGNYMPRLPHFPVPNPADSPAYHQMVVEYMERYRKSLEMDTAGPPLSQVNSTMMAEFTKQYQQHHYNKYYHSRPHQSYFNFSPRPDYPNYDERVYTGYAEKGPHDYQQAFPRSNILPNKSQSVIIDEKNRGYGTATTLQRSSSFQISRIAADSTSNDEFLPGKEKDTEQKNCSISHKNDSNESEISSSKATDGLVDNEGSITSNREHYGSDDEDDIFNRNQNKPFMKRSNRAENELKKNNERLLKRVSAMLSDDDEAFLGRNQDEYISDCSSHVCSDSEEEILRVSNKKLCSDHKKEENEFGNNKKTDIVHQNEQEILGRGTSLRVNETYIRDQQIAESHNSEEFKHHLYHNEKGTVQSSSFPSTDKYTIEQPGLTNGGSLSRLQNNHIPLFTNNQPTSYLSNNLYSSQNSYPHPSVYQLGVMGYPNEGNDKHFESRQHSALKNESQPDWGSFSGANKNNYQKAGVLHQSQTKYSGFSSPSQNYNAESVSTSETLKTSFSHFHSKSSLPQSVSSVSSASNPSFSNSPDSSYFSSTITSSSNNSMNSDKATVSFSTTTSSNIYSTCHPNSIEISGNSMFQQGSISGSMQFPSSGIVNPHYSNPNGPYIPQSTNPLFPESGMAPFTQSSSLPPLSSSITSNPSLIQSSPIPGSVPQSSSPFKINSSPQKSNIVSLHPNSQRYHQIFFYQHQLLIMQFQQYQFQLQLQFQQLNQQQIGQQQQFLLQQQFHQQLILLQQQLVQQQNQLYRMAANGIQFTEHQLNAMYQQQMLTQQSYSQWIVALSPEQQVLFQQRMQACMQQVQHQMAQILQQSSRKEEEQKKKPKPRRSLNKKKSAALLAADSVQTSQPSTKFPVPELSEEMKIRTGQNLVVSKEESLHSEPIQIISKPDSILPINSVSSDSKPNQQNSCKPKPEEKAINPNIISPQYEKIHESFIRHQKQFRGEIPPGPSPLSGYSRCDTQPGQDFQRTQQNDISKPVTTVLSGEISPGSMHQKAEQLLNPRNTVIPPKQNFFPTHPSKLFKQATEKCEKSPSQESLVSNAILPMGETPSFGSRPGINQLSSEPSRIRNPFLNTKTGESSPSNNSAFSVSNLLGTPKKQSLVSTNSQPLFEPAKKANITSEHLSVSQVIKQNDSDLGTNSPNDLVCDNMYHMTDGETEKYEGMNTQLKNLIKLHNKKKDKILEEKKRLRELERIKKKEEKEKIKVIREQRKAEKYQQRMLKQKALQEAKAQQLVIKKHKKIIVPLEIPDMPSGSKTPTIVSPLSSFTPKTPPMVVTPKIPLCEPDVHLVCPLVQPYGFNNSNTFKITGKFGYALIENVIDVYNEKPYTTSPIATSSFLQPISHCSVVVNDILNDVSLFPSPEPNNENSLMHSDIQKDKLLGSIVKEESESIRTISSTQNIMNFKDEDVDSEIEDTISRCNLCYGLLHNAVFYVDKNMENVTECMYDKFELMSSEQLAFCSNECVEAYQRKVDYTFENDDQELIDAVKVSSMVTTDELHVFLPLPSDEIRGDVCASGMSNKLVSKSNCRWKRWRVSSDNEKKTKIKSVKEDINQLMKKYFVALRPSESIRDRRQCCFCLVVGDGEANQSSRLLNCNVDSWVHLNCALWSSEVYESLNGGLHNVDKALTRSKQMRCSYCSKIGATLNCSYTFGAQQRLHCEKSFHFHCALQSHAALYKDKTILCSEHKSLGIRKEELDSYAVQRKVYIERNITEQIARMLSLNNSFERKEYTFRVGNLIFHELGHVPMQLLDNFSSKDFVYPVGFETTSIFWDNHDIQKRRYYTCSISECMKSPRFKVKAHSNGSEGSLYTSSTAKGAINEIIANIQKLREKENCLKVFPEFICGEDFFGLSEPTIQRMIESLPGIDTISNYNFRFGRTPILIAELPLALNPTGCIRTEKCRKHHTKPLAMRTAAEHTHTSDAIITDDSWLVYSQRNVHIMNTKTGQYRRMRQEWRNSVVLGRSRIQGLGLFTKKDIEENTFIIEYIGSLIRNEVANRLEKHYERQNRGIYMFRIDNDTVVDATMAGGPARYINHSCDPNCVAEIVSIEKEKRIIIISSRKIDKGEELTYDYKFELEDDSEKIACLCGSFNCRKWMN